MFDLGRVIFVVFMAVIFPGIIFTASLFRARKAGEAEQKKEKDHETLRFIYTNIGGWFALSRHGEGQPAKAQMRFLIEDTWRILASHKELYPVLAEQVTMHNSEFWLEYLDYNGFSTAVPESVIAGKPMHPIWTATRSFIRP